MMENRIKYRHLQCFLEVSRQGSVGRAADVLALTQPAVSKKLKELEDMLGVRLLDRSKKGVELTQFGEVFIKYAGTSVAALREGANSVAEAKHKGRARLSIGVLPTVAASLMPMTVQKFRESGLDVTLNIVSAQNTLLLSQLRVGELDLVIGRLGEPEQVTGLTFEHLYSERVSFVVRPGHPLLQGNFDASGIAEYTVLYPPQGSIIFPAVESYMVALGIGSIPDRIETISDSFGKEYTRHCNAIWIVSRGVVSRELESGELVELPLAGQETLGPVGLTIRADRVPSAQLRLLMDAARESARQIVHGSTPSAVVMPDRMAS
ncbi:pca operon transcription factor PcaQ [Parathalassolituus penaei]|uniref:Pca operon transcription factor PcaQ n=1 Tax=Parathalassolituus penaei TaxID=2997323 RepID=A0A9X3IUK5_9GAMM|nr:pca operon transcription factor PcaQ [Parathalassolituus penaei]MCY0967044.1 pca operon transcription factor PcaQ [Parathalassolituus penaei]